jgi:uncharacterized peroxidase-related enzyme
MSRLSLPTVDNAPEASKPLFAAVKKQLGVVPNLMKLVGHSPAALEGYLSLNGALARGKLNVKLRESIALAVAEYNGCDYCLSAHAYLGRNVAKLNDDDIEAARDARATDARTDAALHFARRVAESRGRVSDTEIAALRNAGLRRSLRDRNRRERRAQRADQLRQQRRANGHRLSRGESEARCLTGLGEAD